MKTPSHLIAPETLTLDGVITWYASRQPERIVLELYNQEPFTWKWLERAVQGTADSIKSIVAQGEVVGLICEDSIGFHVLINALWRCGVAVLLISKTWGIDVITDLIKITGTNVVFCSNIECLPNNIPVRRETFPSLQFSDTHWSQSIAKIDDIAILATTSGTTDSPKCVAIRHKQIRTAYRTALSVHNFENVQRAASLFPLNGIGVMGVCYLLPREVGAATRMYPPFSMSNIYKTWREIFMHEVDFIYLVPPLVRMLVTLPTFSIAPSSPMLAFCASAPVTRSELRRLEERFPVRVYNTYGLTEMTFAVFFGDRENDNGASDSIGYPVGIEARLINACGETILGTGKGELLLRGPMLTEGYFHNLEATRSMWKKGWLCTGDLAERDGAGRYNIIGRIKDTVIRGGILTYLHELEHYVRRIPCVIDAAAFKGKDLPSGDELCIVVQVSRPTSRDEVLKWIRKHVGKDKVPNALFFWHKELPRNSNGKIMRRTLSELRNSGVLK